MHRLNQQRLAAAVAQKRSGLSFRKAAREAGVSRDIIWRVEQGTLSNPLLDTYLALAAWLGQDLGTFLDKEPEG